MSHSTIGTIYFLQNPSMKGLIKIGFTKGDVFTRIRQLNSTGVPQEFDLAAQFVVTDPTGCEKRVHSSLADLRVNTNREFFEGNLRTILARSMSVINDFLPIEPVEIKRTELTSQTDEDDIYFMQFLLHDCYVNGESISTTELSQYHKDYSPLELDYKLQKLSDLNLVKRFETARKGGLGNWTLTPQGMKFMMEGEHYLEDLIIEARSSQ